MNTIAKGVVHDGYRKQEMEEKKKKIKEHSCKERNKDWG